MRKKIHFTMHKKNIHFMFLFFLAIIIVLTTLVNQKIQEVRQHAASTNLLPGQQIWKNGVSSFLFGTNDTIRWSQINACNTASIPSALHTAHFQLLRTWF